MKNELINENTNHFYELTWKEIHIPMRDGSYLAANFYRPDSDGEFPVLLTMCPYGKDLHFTEFAPANPTIKKEYEEMQDKSPLLSWEAPDPEFWVPEGYAILRIDERGIGKSPGKLDIISVGLKEDFYDAIEWAGTQDWSNGKVGLLGISYLAMSQWSVASLQPPHLTCMIPWEGTVDYYAEFTFPGGMFSSGFIDFWWKNGVLANQYNPDGRLTEEELKENRVEFPEYARNNTLRTKEWIDRSADLSKIEIPFLSVSNWFSAGIHTRGNFRAFENAPSPHKWLLVNIGSHILKFYSVEGRELQKKFLDYWLKGIDTGLMQEPRVKLAIPTGGSDYTWRYENEYPLARTKWEKHYLDASSKSLMSNKIGETSTVEFSGDHDKESRNWGHPFMLEKFDKTENRDKRVLFESAPFENKTEILGPIKLKLWASSTTNDMDIFVSLRHIDAEGVEIVNDGSNIGNAPIAQGWLRASLRKLDPQKSTDQKPYYSFDEVQKIESNKPYPLEIELWDAAMVVKKGHSLLIEIGSQNQSGCAYFLQTSDDRNWDADVTIHTGGKFDSYLQLPIIPSENLS